MKLPKSLESLAVRRSQITDQFATLADLRCGSITSTTGRCGKPNCRCHQPGAPGHGPNLRLTYKLQGKTVTESLPNPAAVRKAEREIQEFRKYQVLQKEFLEVNAQICQMRPSEPDPRSVQEKNSRSHPARSAQGLFVGSGVIEAGCKTVIGSRLKQSGMFGTVQGANRIIALRCCRVSGKFEDFWEQAHAA